MNFRTDVKTTFVDISVEEYFNGNCVKCGSKLLKIRSSYKRVIPDLGAPREKCFLRIKINYFECESCGHSFSPKHPDYPPKIEYSPAIITYALDSYYQFNCSGNEITHDLNKKHNVEVPLDTIYTWIKRYSEKYLKSIKKEKILADPEKIKTVSIDGTFTSAGKDVIGKKKPVVLLSLTKQKNGMYSLTLSEMRP